MVPKVVLIEDSGWGDILLGVVVGALELPSYRFIERRIPTVFFQPPRFNSRDYLERTVEIVKEIIEVTKANRSTLFKVCSGHILSSIRTYLFESGFKIHTMKTSGDLYDRIENSYVDWCVEVGIPRFLIRSGDSAQRFWTLLNWVKENPNLRERLVKTGWKSWNKQWRNYAHSIQNK